LVKARKVNKCNQLSLKKLNPLTSDTRFITSLLPDDDTDLNDIVESTKFITLLKCDAIISDGRAAVSAYYNMNETWNKANHDCNFVDNYCNLLYLVKTTSTNDNIYISFVEGLHCHTAIITSLLCAKFDHSNNTFVPGLLTVKHFKKPKIPHFRNPDDFAVTP
jgi:hypothetical protein